MKLFEETKDVHIYMDDSTGKYYYFNGKKLVLLGSKPQIGDTGSDDFQRKEEEERKKQIEKEREEDRRERDEFSPPSTSGDSSSEDGEEDEDARLKRLNRIKDLLNDKDTASRISGEAEDKVDKERMAKATRDLRKYSNSALSKFKESLQGFIKKEIGEVKNSSWAKINKKYAGTGTIKPGTSKHATGKVPLINVYFDRSGSWDSEKTKVGEQAIGTLNNYVRQGKLKIDLYYFNNDVFSNDRSGNGWGGTNPVPVMNHINATKPDNVIIMTDSDFDWYDDFPSATVPGGVWMLFKGGVSRKLQERLKGKKLTKSFELES